MPTFESQSVDLERFTFKALSDRLRHAGPHREGDGVLHTSRDSVRPMPTEHTLQALASFVAERDWDQFHSPENLAKSISIEAGELLECYQWNPEPDHRRVEDELADVVTYCIHLANKLGVDLDEIVMRKLESTAAKYPVELARGRMTKYTEL